MGSESDNQSLTDIIYENLDDNGIDVVDNGISLDVKNFDGKNYEITINEIK